MQKAEKVRVVANGFELLVTAAVQEIFAVNNVWRIGDLSTTDRKFRVHWAKAIESNKHRFTSVGILEEWANFSNAFFFVHGIKALTEADTLWQEVLGVLWITSLVLWAVKVICVTGGVKLCLTIADSHLTDLGDILI